MADDKPKLLPNATDRIRVHVGCCGSAAQWVMRPLTNGLLEKALRDSESVRLDAPCCRQMVRHCTVDIEGLPAGADVSGLWEIAEGSRRLSAAFAGSLPSDMVIALGRQLVASLPSEAGPFGLACDPGSVC